MRKEIRSELIVLFYHVVGISLAADNSCPYIFQAQAPLRVGGPASSRHSRSQLRLARTFHPAGAGRSINGVRKAGGLRSI